MVASYTVPMLRSVQRAPVVGAFRTLLLVALALAAGPAWAQIEVTATAGTPGPTNYGDLRSAFAAVNAGTHQGAVTIEITASPAVDNNTAVLNASGSGSANYASVLVRPAGSVGARTIMGSVAGGPLVDLNGADNVTIDGREGDGYTLTFSNQSTSSSAGTSTLRFVNDATANVVQECLLLGRSTGTVATLSGTVLFGTGTSGNDDNTIADCTIANDGTGTTDLVSKAVMSVGATGSLAAHNSGNTISGCLVHDFFLAGGSRGVLLGAGNHDWSIVGNRFYQTAPRTTATAGSQHCVIDIAAGSNASAGAHLIADNVIGYADAAGTGTWTLSGSTNLFRAIRAACGSSGPRCTISGNSIAALAQASEASGTGASSPSTAIHVLDGPVDVLDNTIGSLSATGSFVYTPSAAGRDMHAILNSGSTDWTTRHNRIGGITFAGDGGLHGVRSIVAGVWQCDSNQVGGTVIGSVQMTGTGTGGVVNGLSASNATVVFADNLVHNLSSTGTGTSVVHGIVGSGGNVTVHRDTIMDLTGAASVRGIWINNAPADVADNTVSLLQGVNVEGIRAGGANCQATGNTITDLEGAVGAGYSTVHGIAMLGDSLTATANHMAGLTNGSTASNALCTGIYGTGAVHAEGNTITGLGGVNIRAIYTSAAPLLALDNTITGLTGTGGAVHAVVSGISVTSSSCVATGNTITELANPATGSVATTCGIAVAHGPLLAQGNTVQQLEAAVIAKGISAYNAPAQMLGNLITACEAANVAGLHAEGGAPCEATDNTITALSAPASAAYQVVTGIHISGDSLTAGGNAITGLLNGSTASSSVCNGVYGVSAVLHAADNTITGLGGANTYGVNVASGMLTALGNTITDLTGTATTGNALVRGIAVSSGACNAGSNHIVRLANSAPGSSASTAGIHAVHGDLVATGNTVAGLRGQGTTGGVVGILAYNTSGTPLVQVRSNTLHTLCNTQAAHNGTVHGISATLRDTANVIEGNVVHTLWQAGSGNGVLRGIRLVTGTGTVRNNMVHLGLDSVGASLINAHLFQGIQVSGGTFAVLHNSVYIGGEVASGSNHTYALLSEVTTARDHRNNILWNARTNTGGTAKHFAIGVNSNLTGLTSDHNCLYVTGTGGVLGREGSTDRSTLAAWQSATGLDANSLSTDPGLVNVSGLPDDLDLHIQYNGAGASALNGAGATGTGVTADLDGASRGVPPDIGADEILLVLPDFYEEPANANLLFWENKGQVADTDHQPRPDIAYYSDRGEVRTYLRKGSAFSLVAYAHDTSAAATDTTWRVDVALVGGKVRLADPHGWDPTTYHRNYYYPWCDVEGATYVRGHDRVVYEDVYPHTDLHFYSGSGGPKMSFVVSPGGDHENIQLSFAGQDSLTVDGFGVLTAHLSGWSLPLVGGIAYQVDGGGTIVPIDLATYLNDTAGAVVTFAMSFSSTYDPDLPLVIQVGPPPALMGGGGVADPRNLNWSTYLNSNGGDEMESIDVDLAGNPYVCGYVSSEFYPIISGTIAQGINQVQGSIGNDGVVTKFNRESKQIEWISIIGGTGRTDAYKLAVYNGDSPGHQHAFVTGGTNCLDFPTYANPASEFSIADWTLYEGGRSRTWIAALRKFNGILDWSTTHGELGNSETWNEYGLAIDIDDEDETLMVGGKMYSFPDVTTPVFPSITPGGAFTRATGDGFFILFDADFQIEWSSAFCESNPWLAAGGVLDICLTRDLGGNRLAWLVGATQDEIGQSFDLMPASGGGYYQAVTSGLSPFVAVLGLNEHTLEYSTRWGTPNPDGGGKGMAHAVYRHKEYVWVVGYTDAADLTLAQLPPPPGDPGDAHWSLSNNSDPDGYHYSTTPSSEGFILRYNVSTDDYYPIDYGTLVGGDRDDVLLDVTSDGNGRIYITGETRSASGFMEDLDPELYYQPQHGDPYRRDAFILGLISDSHPSMFWRTAFGGEESDRGRGIAATPQEVFICGSTSSSEDEEFPLLEYNAGTDLDYYWESFLDNSGAAGPFIRWRDFNWMMDLEDTYGSYGIEGPNFNYDGFIAGFTTDWLLPVGVPQGNSGGYGDLRIWPLTGEAVYAIRLPYLSEWHGGVFDMTGRKVADLNFQGISGIVNMGMAAPGIYLVSLHDAVGRQRSTKFLVP